MKVQAFNLSMTGVVTRFYAMMLIAIVLGFLGVNWVLIAFIIYPLAFTTILGVSFELPSTAKKVERVTTMSSVKGSKLFRKVG